MAMLETRNRNQAATPPSAAAPTGRSNTKDTGCPPQYAINGAFLQEIKDSAIEVRDTADTIEHLCQCPPWDMRCLRLLTEAMDRWRDQLAMIFALEETYGYVQLPPRSPLDRLDETESKTAGGGKILGGGKIPGSERLGADGPTPRANAPDELRRQHSTLYLFVSELAEAAEELQFRGYDAEAMQDLVGRIADFCEMLDRHERDELEWIRC
ncbi:MAG: hypothetical protein AAF958_02620 [Planctomycetota bacterium]